MTSSSIYLEPGCLNAYRLYFPSELTLAFRPQTINGTGIISVINEIIAAVTNVFCNPIPRSHGLNENLIIIDIPLRRNTTAIRASPRIWKFAY